MMIILLFTDSFTFKKSAWKSDQNFEFHPTNLHLQRMLAQNVTLKKKQIYDIYTVGAFSAHSRKTKLPSPTHEPSSEKLLMAETNLKNVLQLRRFIIECMNSILKMCQVKRSEGLGSLVEALIEKTQQLSEVSQVGMLGQSLSFIESNRIKSFMGDDVDESVTAFMERNKKFLAAKKQL